MIKLLIDSASDINQEEADKLGVTLLPIEVRFGEEEYLDGVNLLPSQFYQKLQTCKELPKTSQINPFRYEEEFEKATKDGDEAIVITLSSKLSGTYLSACQASEKFNGKVYVVDSLNACTGQKLLGFYALELIKKGFKAQEIVDELNKAKMKVRALAVIDTLKYLKMGGRISALTAVVGGALSVKPLIAVIDGEVKTIGKGIGTKKAYKMLMEKITENQIDFQKPYGFIWSGLTEDGIDMFIEENASELNIPKDKAQKYVIGSTIGTHVGPGAVGIAFFDK